VLARAVSHWGKLGARCAVVVGAAACALLIAVAAGQGVERAGALAAVVGAVAAVAAAVAAVWPLLPRGPAGLVPREQVVAEWAVGRPAELDAVVGALLASGDGAVGITTALRGAGGFGKTMLAVMACADPRVRRRFSGGVHLVIMGRDVRGGAAVAGKVNDVIRAVSGQNATFTDPNSAGAALGTLLDSGPRRLLVLDDVWEPEQLTPFGGGGKRCALLVTTRVLGLLGGRDVAVLVDQMTPEQARQLLTNDVPRLDPIVVHGLLAVTGRWPLLLRLTNRILANADTVGADTGVAATQLLERLRACGPQAADDVAGVSGQILNVDRPGDRARAVRATIEASTSLLSPHDRDRLAELAVVAEDEPIAIGMAARLWHATAELDDLSVSQVLARLVGLALVSPAAAEPGGVTMHGVIRDFLRGDLGSGRLTELNGVLVDAMAADLPQAEPLDDTAGHAALASWWEISSAPGERYLRDHLIAHLLAAGRAAAAAALACDLRWVGTRIQADGPAALAADLSQVRTPRADRLQALLGQVAHLLAVTTPSEAVVDILHSRIANDPDWGPQAAALAGKYARLRLVSRWSLPDLPGSALRRVLTGHSGPVTAVAIAAGGSWLATASEDQTVRTWDSATGHERFILTGHSGPMTAVAIEPDGTWFATAGTSDDGMARIWAAATGREGAALTGHEGWITAVAVAPDGKWVVTASTDGTARTWDAATGQERATLTGHRGPLTAVAVAPDGKWVATASEDGTARIWDAGDQELVTMASGRSGWMTGVAAAADSTWLATASHNGTVRTWDAATGQERATLRGHDGPLTAVAIASDGTWLATASHNGTVRTWDAATGQERATLNDHRGPLTAVAIAPDGTWLATGSHAGTARIYDTATSRRRAVLTGHDGPVTGVAIAPQGTWLATTGTDGTTRIWEPAIGRQLAVLRGHDGPLTAVAIASDGTWLATASHNGTVRTYDPATGLEQVALTGHNGPVTALAVMPHKTWLATTGTDGTSRIWDLATGQPLAMMRVDDELTDCAWLAVGGLALVGPAGLYLFHFSGSNIPKPL
jgi:WD40 repeat protein